MATWIECPEGCGFMHKEGDPHPAHSVKWLEAERERWRTAWRNAARRAIRAFVQRSRWKRLARKLRAELVREREQRPAVVREQMAALRERRAGFETLAKASAMRATAAEREAAKLKSDAVSLIGKQVHWEAQARAMAHAADTEKAEAKHWRARAEAAERDLALERSGRANAVLVPCDQLAALKAENETLRARVRELAKRIGS